MAPGTKVGVNMRMKVFGGALIKRGKQQRYIVAATSAKSAAQSAGCSVSEVQKYWSVTSNAKELSVALHRPGILFQKTGDLYGDGDYVEVNAKGERVI